MSMPINRISASGVAAMLYPFMKPSRVANIGGGSRTSSSSSAVAIQGTSSQPSADTTSTADQIHAVFELATAALNDVGMASAVVQSSVNQEQVGSVQQGGSMSAQADQQAGSVSLFLNYSKCLALISKYRLTSGAVICSGKTSTDNTPWLCRSVSTWCRQAMMSAAAA